MEKLCISCNQIKETPYKNLCRPCYHAKWKPTLQERICACGKKYKEATIQCPSCTRKKRLNEKKKKPCSDCGRKGLLILDIGNNLCTKCSRNKKDKEIPGWRENRLKVQRKFARKYRGHTGEALNAPPKEKSTGRWINVDGYMMIYKKGHPNSNCNDCIKEHTFVMSEHLKRPLMKGENVHHKNGIRHDNRIENLEIWHKSQPCGQRLSDKIEWSKNFLESYGFKIDDSDIIEF